MASRTPPRLGLRPLAHVFAAELRALGWTFIQANAITLTAVVAGALAPWPLKWIIDSLLQPTAAGVLPPAIVRLGPEAGIVALGAIFLALALIGAIAESSDGVVSARIRERLSFAMRDRMVRHLQTLPPTIRTTHRSGELVLRIVGDVDQFARLWTKTLPLLVKFAATSIVTVAGIAWLSPWMGLACVAFLPALFALVRVHGRRVADASRVKRRREGDVAGVAQEIVRGLPVLQALGATDGARARFAAVSADGLRAGVVAAQASARFERSFEVARGVVTAGVTVGGALLVLRGWLTIGELTVMCAYVAQLVRPIDKIDLLTESVTKGLVAGERLVRLLQEQPLVSDAAGAIELRHAAGRIELRDVCFAYPKTGAARAAVLHGVTMSLVPGRLTVLQGASGAGKSTLVSLLLRLFDPASGSITLDDRPLAAATLRSLRSQFAVMTQDLHLFAGTLRQALTLDAGRVEEERIWSALAFVALDAFVRDLPGALETPLGEDGINLSGGQRQRLSLARAFLLDRPVLLLDEPLANVDAESARVILEALHRFRVGRTCLAITHESTLVAHADVVYRLAHGTVTLEPRPRAVLELVR